jgi:hypothetical protein
MCRRWTAISADVQAACAGIDTAIGAGTRTCGVAEMRRAEFGNFIDA